MSLETKVAFLLAVLPLVLYLVRHPDGGIETILFCSLILLAFGIYEGFHDLAKRQR